jgi:glycerol-3-phosphate O-acyltransferase / dihydroxyacetone phosphate acyltransferase
MIRRITTAIIALLAKIFFRRIEVGGVENVPRDEGVIFAVNHPNGLIDPLFLLVFAPRPVSFLAKAPIFTMPVIGWFARALDSIPVFRRQDKMKTESNRETFAAARALLARGGAIAIFPEGTSHSDSRLRELKTGASRIALGASIRVSIVPTGLYYTAKQTFRSGALAVFGTPIIVDPEPVDANGEPRPESVDALTRRIEEGLSAVTWQADSREALELIARAARIFVGGETADLAGELELRRRFVAGYAFLREHDPARLAKLQARIARFDAEELAAAERPTISTLARLLLLPIGLIGMLIHWPVYRLIRFLAVRMARDDELIATIKTLAGMALYPLLWIAAGVLVGLRFGARYGLMTTLLFPLVAWVALVVYETLDDLIGRLRAVRHHDARVEQQAIREEILAVAKQMNV